MPAYAACMRAFGLIIGVLAILAGAVWVLQGLGLIPGSFMSRNPTWVVIGLVTLVVGVVLVTLSRRGRDAG